MIELRTGVGDLRLSQWGALRKPKRQFECLMAL